MSGDTLSDVLRAVRLRSAVFYYIDGSSPWVAEAPPAREIIPAIMPGAEHMIEFHGVIEGSCWAAIVGEPAVRLDERDVILSSAKEAQNGLVLSVDWAMRGAEPVRAPGESTGSREPDGQARDRARAHECPDALIIGSGRKPGSSARPHGFRTT